MSLSQIGELNQTSSLINPATKIYPSGVITNAFELKKNPTNGYVLTSDSSGNGTWQASSGVSVIATPTIRHVSSAGVDSSGSDGGYVSPYATILFAESKSIQGYVINISPGPAHPYVPSPSPPIAWQGAGASPIDSVINTSGPLTINTTTWNAATAPTREFSNLTLNSSINYSNIISVISGSQINFTDCIINGNITISQVETINLTRVVCSGTMLFTDCVNVNVTDCPGCTGSFTFHNNITSPSNESVTFNNVGFGTVNYTIDGGAVNSNYTTTNSYPLAIGSLNFANNIDTNPITYSYDYVSLNKNFTTVSGDETLKTFDINFASYNVDNGFASNPMPTTSGGYNFMWTGKGTNPGSLIAGYAGSADAQHTYMFGNSISAFANTFAFGDQGSSTFTPQVASTFCARAANGVGFQTDTPKATFHAASGSNLICGNGLIADGNMAIQEINLSVPTSGTSLFAKWKDHAGTTHTTDLSFPIVVNSFAQIISLNRTVNTSGKIFEVITLDPTSASITTGMFFTFAVTNSNLISGSNVQCTVTNYAGTLQTNGTPYVVINSTGVGTMNVSVINIGSAGAGAFSAPITLSFLLS